MNKLPRDLHFRLTEMCLGKGRLFPAFCCLWFTNVSFPHLGQSCFLVSRRFGLLMGMLGELPDAHNVSPSSTLFLVQVPGSHEVSDMVKNRSDVSSVVLVLSGSGGLLGN